MTELIIDNFAGGGGASLGIERALGRPVDIAINHDEAAIIMHKANHPNTKHLCEDIWTVNPLDATKGRPIALAWFSPDCTHFSSAKGGKPVKKKIRGLAWVVIRWAKLVKPRVIILENVTEFRTWGPLTKDDQPCPDRKGQTFKIWANQLRRLGYEIQWRELVAADYGVPTIRKRLFIIARCDGQPIVWPAATHGKGLLPYRTAAECIDWTLPCPSIFLTKAEAKKLRVRRPLAENTLRRIAKGIQKFVIEAKEPFIVTCNHSGKEFRGQNLKEPFRTITASRDAHGLVVPYVAAIDHQGSNGVCVNDVKKPLGTITRKNRFALVAAFLTKYYTCQNPCAGLNEPAPTVTAIDHNAIVATHLTKFYGTNTGSDMKRPMPTITGTGQHIGEVRAFFIKYYGTNIGHSLKEPMHTITGKHRFGLVTVAGQQYQIADIGLRMLSPRELARAQGFPDSYILTGTKTSQVAKIGNSVCPVLTKVLVRANVKLKTAANEESAA